MDKRALKDQLALFGRLFALLLNRSLMYQATHPVVKQSVADVHRVADRILEHTSPLVFILDRGHFYIDEEPLDPRINVNRAAALFKSAGIQSVSFENGLAESELLVFSELFSNLTRATSAEAIKNNLYQKGVFNIKVNHVIFKKVTEDDQVVSRETLKQVTPLLDADDEQNRKRFMETLLESVLTEEFAKTLNITNMMANPAAFSKKMIEIDLAGATAVPSAPKGDAPGYGTEVSPDIDADDDTGAGAGPDSGPGARKGAGGGDGAAAGNIGGGVSGQAVPDDAHPGGGAGATAQTGTYAAGGTLHGPEEGVGTGSGPGAAGGARPTGGQVAGMGGGPGGDQQASGRPLDARAGTGDGAGGMPGRSGEPTGSRSGSGMAAAAPGADPATSQAGPMGHGPLLLHQLELMHNEVQKHLQGQGEVSIADLAQAIFDMKKQLLEGIHAQKALGIAYANEAAIVQSANQLADQVLMELIKEEYQAGKVTTQRLAQLIRRMIPEAAELRRLLPQIKRTLLAEGMPMTEYLSLINELRNELQSEELARILEESSATIGLDGESLIEEVKRNPGQAAELIYLASEIRKGGGDDSVLSDILVEYVEHLGTQMAKDASAAESGDGSDHLKKVMTDIESTILKKLGQMNVNTDVLTRMEARLNERMESIMDKMRVQWLQTQPGQKPSEKTRILTVLQTLEHNMGDDEELAVVLKTVRTKVEAGEIEENNYSQIHEEINRQKKMLREQIGGRTMAEGILSADDVMFVMEKEIARAKRYGTFFSAISLAFVSAKPTMKALDSVLTQEMILDTALEKLSASFREVDYIGRIGKNKIMALLPVVDQPGAKKALERILRMLHAAPLDIGGVPVQLRVAGVAAGYDDQQAPTAQQFAKQIARQLSDMIARLKNIQVLF